VLLILWVCSHDLDPWFVEPSYIFLFTHWIFGFSTFHSHGLTVPYIYIYSGTIYYTTTAWFVFSLLSGVTCCFVFVFTVLCISFFPSCCLERVLWDCPVLIAAVCGVLFKFIYVNEYIEKKASVNKNSVFSLFFASHLSVQLVLMLL